MARPQKEGIDYFPLDTDMDQDKKVYFIIAKYCMVGFGILIKLLMHTYSNGYYLPWDDKEALMFTKTTLSDINVVNNLIQDALVENFFDKTLYEKYGILTSSGIQKRYLAACARRGSVEMFRGFLLIDETKYKNLVIVDKNPCPKVVNVYNNYNSTGVNVDNGTQSKVKESKVENSKENESIENELLVDNFPPNDLITKWNTILEIIKPKFSEISYKSWFITLSPISLEGNTIKLRVKDDFHKRIVNERGIPILKQAIKQVINDVENIELQEVTDNENFKEGH